MWSTREGDPEYRMTRWDPGGDTTLLVETRRPAVPVPAAVRDSVIDGMREMLSNMGVGRQFDWSRIPSVKPAVEAIFQSAEGNLWVRTPSGGEGALFDRLLGGRRPISERPAWNPASTSSTESLRLCETTRYG